MKHQSEITAGQCPHWLCTFLVLLITVACLLGADEKSSQPSQVPAATKLVWTNLKERAGKSSVIEFEGRTLYRKKLCWLKLRLEPVLALKWLACLEQSSGEPIEPLMGQYSAAYAGFMTFRDGAEETGHVRFLDADVGVSMDGSKVEKWFDWNQKFPPAMESLDALLSKAEKGEFEVLAISYNMYRKPW